LEFDRPEREVRNSENTLSFRYRDVSYSGTIPELNEQLTNVYASSQFSDIPQFKKDNLKIRLATVREQKRAEKYKEYALVFLKELYAFEDFKGIYNDALYNVITQIQEDMRKIDIALEKLFVAKKLESDKHPLNGKPKADYTSEDEAMISDYEALLTERQSRLEKLVGHRWMEEQFADFTSKETIEQPIGFLEEFKNRMATKAYQRFDDSGDIKELETFLENELIDFYYKKSLKVVNPELFELRYINKN